MIRGRYLTSVDDLSPVLSIRRQVFEKTEDAFDEMAVYALALDHDGCPAGAGRLYIDADDRFRLDLLGVVEDKRRMGLGDLMIRMLLQRALDLNAPAIVLDAPEDLEIFFARYGFDKTPEGGMLATPETIARCYGCSGHCGH